MCQLKDEFSRSKEKTHLLELEIEKVTFHQIFRFELHPHEEAGKRTEERKRSNHRNGTKRKRGKRFLSLTLFTLLVTSLALQELISQINNREEILLATQALVASQRELMDKEGGKREAKDREGRLEEKEREEEDEEEGTGREEEKEREEEGREEERGAR